ATSVEGGGRRINEVRNMTERFAPPAANPDLTPHSQRPSATDAKSASILARLRLGLKWLREFFEAAPAAGASLVLSLIAGLLIAMPDQMRESLRILGESWLRIVAFLIATLLASLTAW